MPVVDKFIETVFEYSTGVACFQEYLRVRISIMNEGIFATLANVWNFAKLFNKKLHFFLKNILANKISMQAVNMVEYMEMVIMMHVSEIFRSAHIISYLKYSIALQSELKLFHFGILIFLFHRIDPSWTVTVKLNMQNKALR